MNGVRCPRKFKVNSLIRLLMPSQRYSRADLFLEENWLRPLKVLPSFTAYPGVGIATGYGLEDPGFRQDKTFSLLHSVQTGTQAHPASYPIGTGAISPGVKRPGREADHSPPSSAEVNNGGAIPPPPHIFS
jgi:hypothetical protein